MLHTQPKPLPPAVGVAKVSTTVAAGVAVADSGLRYT